VDTRSTTLSSITTYQTTGLNSIVSTSSKAAQTRSHDQRPCSRNQQYVRQPRERPPARMASVTWPPVVAAAPSSRSRKVVRARAGTAAAMRAMMLARMGGIVP